MHLHSIGDRRASPIQHNIHWHGIHIHNVGLHSALFPTLATILDNICNQQHTAHIENVANISLWKKMKEYMHAGGSGQRVVCIYSASK